MTIGFFNETSLITIFDLDLNRILFNGSMVLKQIKKRDTIFPGGFFLNMRI